MRLKMLLAFVLFHASVALAGTITAVVLDQQGKPVEGAVVMLLEAKGRFKAPRKPAVMDQVGKKFVPYVLPVLVGTKVEFPNQDDIHHHVYSFSKPKRFDLPLYKGKPAEPIVMDSTGVVKLGCNIHDWMAAHVLVLPHPYFAVTGPDGKASIEKVPAGKHKVAVWSPRRKEQPSASARELSVPKKGAAHARFALKFGMAQEQKPAGVGGGRY